MSIKLNKKIRFEIDLTSSKNLGNDKLKALFNAEEEDQLIVHHAILDDLASVQLLDENALTEIRAATKNEKDRRNLLRYGQVLSIDEYTHWVLTVLSRAASQKRNSRSTISSLLGEYVSFLNGNVVSSDSLQFIDKNQIKNEMKVYSHSLLLKKAIYVKNEDQETEIVEGFIPDMTYHPILLLRGMLMCLIEPKFLDDIEIQFLTRLLNIDEKISNEGLKESLLKISRDELIEKLIDEMNRNESASEEADSNFIEKKWQTNFLMIENLGSSGLGRFLKRFELSKMICNSLGELDLTK